MAKIAHSIAQIEKLEDRARRLRNELDDVELKWNAHRKTADSSPEWEKHCEDKGISRFYTFGDILA